MLPEQVGASSSTVPWIGAHDGRLGGQEVGAVLVLDSAAVSSRGPRPDNQDSAVGGPLLIAIADGVGGNVGGAVASSLVVNWLAPLSPASSPRYSRVLPLAWATAHDGSSSTRSRPNGWMLPGMWIGSRSHVARS